MTEPSAKVFLSEPFELVRGKIIKVKVDTVLDNSWLDLEADLINEAEGEAIPFDIGVEYYHGVEDGESWSEGDQKATKYLSAPSSGKYILRLEGHWEKQTQPIFFNVEISQTALDPILVFLVFGWITLIPIVMGILSLMFEGSRWGESMYGSSSS